MYCDRSLFTIFIYGWEFDGGIYSVMQSDGNSFYGDVVLDGFNMSFRDEDSILEQKYKNQISWDLYYEDYIFHK